MAFDLTMGGQFALIPAKVLYDDHIPATAKLLYGEIYRLSHANGYCYATNKDFMALLQRSENTVTDLIKALETAVEKTEYLMRYSSSTYLEVLTAEQSLLSAKTDLVQTRYDQIYSIISLYSALGGR